MQKVWNGYTLCKYTLLFSYMIFTCILETEKKVYNKFFLKNLWIK